MVKSTSQAMGQIDTGGPQYDPLRRTQHHFYVVPAKNVKPECNLEEIISQPQTEGQSTK